LFFPEKLLVDENWKRLSTLMSEEASSTDQKLRVPVLTVRQNRVILYTGKLSATDVVRLYGISRFHPETGNGYQRELNERRAQEIEKYLLTCPVAILPGLLVSLREEAKFLPFSAPFEANIGFGVLEVPLRKGSIWVVDGQHRIGGLDRAILSFMEDGNGNLSNYEVPVTFIDAIAASRQYPRSSRKRVTPEDVERLVFFLVNRTQKAISPSLKDALEYYIWRTGIHGLPVIGKERWRPEATSIAFELSSTPGSPFYQKISFVGDSGDGKPVRLHSFVSSLRPVFSSRDFCELSHADKSNLLTSYWNQVRRLERRAFEDKTYSRYLLLKAVGIHALNWLLADYILGYAEKDESFLDLRNVQRFVSRLRGFDWSRESSPIAHFGGMAGVKEARRILLDYMFSRNARKP